MEPITLVSIALCVFSFGLISRRIEGTPITPPMLFAAIGLLAGPFGLGVLHFEEETADLIIEATLVLVLFSDASRIRFRQLRRGYLLPARLLLLGLPLTIGAGMVLARPLFPELTWAELALLAAVLAPTDAALGQAVVSSSRVPIRIRQALNVESGLNDGIAVPIVMVAVAASSIVNTSGGSPADMVTGAQGFSYALAQIGFGLLAGFAVACPAAWLVQRATKTGGMSRAFEHFSGLAIAMGGFGAAELIGGNGFIAAFSAGLVVGNTTTSICESLQEFAEEEGQLLSLIAFLAFGAMMLPSALASMGWDVALYVLLSLTIVRMLPVAIALLGTRLRMPSVAFIGWFGPRGLATILFVLLISEHEGIHAHERLAHIATLVVAASVIAHGATAAPLAALYSRWEKRLRATEPGSTECHPVADLRVRIRLHDPVAKED